MRKDTLTLGGMIGLFAVLPVIHEVLHYIPAWFFGLAPVFDWNTPAVLYFGKPTVLMLLVCRHLPDLTFLTIALAVTLKYRNNSFGLVFVIPLLLMGTQGLLGHIGVL